MGCFDTFMGSIQCPHCNKMTHFEEQTKDYECILNDFKVGDYIDKANTNYFYKFDYPCSHCKKDIEISAVIRNGQLVGYYTDIDTRDIDTFDNIEEGYQRKLEYKLMCQNGYGIDTCLYDEFNQYNYGDIIHTLNRDWIVDKIFEEVLDENIQDEKVRNFHKFLYKKNKIYVVHDKQMNPRMIVMMENQPTYITALLGSETSNLYSTFRPQIGTILKEL